VHRSAEKLPFHRAVFTAECVWLASDAQSLFCESTLVVWSACSNESYVILCSPMSFQTFWSAISRCIQWVGTSTKKRHKNSDVAAAETRYTAIVSGGRRAARERAKEGNVLAVVGTAANPKWALVKCPCGCNQILELNLMRRHYPRWRLTILPNGGFALAPSVHSLACGAHFWFVDGRVFWARSYSLNGTRVDGTATERELLD